MSRILKYTLLFGLLLSPVVLFTQLSLWSVELEAEEVVERGKARAVKRVEQSIETLRATVQKRLEEIVEAASSRQFGRIEREKGAWEVYVFGRDLNVEFPVIAPAPPLDSPVAERDLSLLYRAWLRSRDAAGARRIQAKLLWSSSSPRMQASALARLAGSALRAGDGVEALEHLGLLLARFPGARDVSGLALGPSAGLARARLLARLGHAEGRKAAVQLLSDLTFNRFTLLPAEVTLFSARARELVAEAAAAPAVPAAEREQIGRLLTSPFPRLFQRYKAGPGMREVEGRIEHFDGREYLQFDRRVGDLVVLALAPAEEISRLFSQALETPYVDGYQVFVGQQIPAAEQERFEAVLRMEVPYLGSPVVLGGDRAQILRLRKTRKTFLVALVTLALLMLGLGGYLIARDVRRHLELARLKSDFIANVGHELKTPLTTIRMFAETLVDGRVKPERARDYLKKILIESDHLTMLIDNVLQLSRAEEVVIDGRLAPTTLGCIADEAIQQLAVRWEDRAVERAVPDLPVVCDGNLVVLAVANLLDNAAKYGDPARAIAIAGGFKNGQVWISVTDRGRGIPASEQPRIFQRFYRAKNALERKGMGLGLFLVQKIADLHGGKVEFRSQEGVGSTFTMRLPARTRDDSVQPAATTGEPT